MKKNSTWSLHLGNVSLVGSSMPKYSKMKAWSKLNSSSVTFCGKGVFEAIFFFFDLTKPLDDSKGKDVGSPNTI